MIPCVSQRDDKVQIDHLAQKVTLTSDGLHLDGSILWFDATKSGELSFLSSANVNASPVGPQIISTEETLKMLEIQHRKPKALVCQYNRPFSVGRLTMELLPSGSILGGASLHVSMGDRRSILYAPNIQLQKNATVRKLQLRKAEILVLRVNHPDPHSVMPSRKRETERLIQAIRTHIDDGVWPTVLCKSMPTAQEITKVLSDADIPLAVHTTIFRINRIYETFGSKLGNYSLYKPKKPRSKVTILPLLSKGFGNYSVPKGPLLYIEDTMSDSFEPEFFSHVTDRYYISSSADAKDLKDVIQTVSPKEVFIFGPYAKSYVDELRTEGIVVKPLYRDNQPSLF